MTPDNCPKCNCKWKDDKTIFEHFLNKKGYSIEDATSTAKMYGCTPDTPKHFSENVIGIEIQGEYDGVSRWECQECLTEFDRWTLKEIKKEL